MATSSTVDNLWATFNDLKTVLGRNISLLSLISFSLMWQINIVPFLVEEQARLPCKDNGNCSSRRRHIKPDYNTTANSSNELPIEFGDFHFLVASQYASMLLGTIVMGQVADVCGRLKALYSSLFFVFIGGLSSAFFMEAKTVFSILRSIVVFFSGGAFYVAFVLGAEYVVPLHRAAVICILWTSVEVSLLTITGIAYICKSRQIVLIIISLPLFLVAIFWRVLPESPRWVLLNSVNSNAREAQALLQRVVSEEQRQTSRYRLCWTIRGGFPSAENQQKKDRWFCFLRRREARRITIVVGLVWFSLGMLVSGLNMSSIQLLQEFYGNCAVREVVNLLGIVLCLGLVMWFGRRVSLSLALVLGGLSCIMFSISSQGFMLAEQKAIKIVIQLVGRLFVMMALSASILYSIELFPTIVREIIGTIMTTGAVTLDLLPMGNPVVTAWVGFTLGYDRLPVCGYMLGNSPKGRCSALGLVTAIGFFGAGSSPLLMKLQKFHPILPLGLMGCISVTTGILCQCLLPKTKGSFTLETFEEDLDPTLHFSKKMWSPKVHRRRRIETKDESLKWESNDAIEDSMAMDDEDSDECEELRHSWEVSSDRASRTSKWEMLSYEDARKTPQDQSISIDQCLDQDSNLLSDRDLEKMSKYVPSYTWVLVYSTFTHGTSLKTLYHRLREVETPVLLVVKDSNGFVFGVLSPEPPKMGNNFYGCGKSFFFTCKPKFKIYPCSGKNLYYMTGDGTGLGFGCSEGTFGLWLDSDLYHGRSTACDTYNSDMLSATEDFLCHGVEVWTFT